MENVIGKKCVSVEIKHITMYLIYFIVLPAVLYNEPLTELIIAVTFTMFYETKFVKVAITQVHIFCFGSKLEQKVLDV